LYETAGNSSEIFEEYILLLDFVDQGFLSPGGDEKSQYLLISILGPVQSPSYKGEQSGVYEKPIRLFTGSATYLRKGDKPLVLNVLLIDTHLGANGQLTTAVAEQGHVAIAKLLLGRGGQSSHRVG
jgi:hypothetical protein